MKYKYYVIRLDKIECIVDNYIKALLYIDNLKRDGYDYGIQLIKGKMVDLIKE